MINNQNKNLYFYSKTTIVIGLFFLFVFNISVSEAVTLNKDNYDYGEDILYVDNVGATMFFDLNSDTANFLGSEHEAGFNINESGAIFDNGNYVILEHTSGDNDCYWNQSPTEPYTSKLEECRNSPEFINEFSFTVNTRPSGGGGGGDEEPELDEELAPVKNGSSFSVQLPEVRIFSFIKNSFFSDKLILDYIVTDENDNGGDFEKSNHGLPINPVSIFYSDKVSQGYQSFIGGKDRTEIAKNQPKINKYEWSVKDLIPGILYKIIVEATDLYGLVGQGISEFFSVDFSAPSFSVSANPNIVRSGDVKIFVDSSEDLNTPPVVFVIQNGGEERSVLMKGKDSHYEGTYSVVSGFDGTASVKVSGTDLAGNKGDAVVSGGTFSIGVNPPPKPKINNYIQNIVTNVEYIDFSGSARSDTEVILKVNGIEVSKLKPDVNGNFVFNKIKLDKLKNKGINYIDIVSIDPAGSISESSAIEVKYNIPPTVSILKPTDKEFLSNITQISVDGKDENSDLLLYTYQIISSSKFKNKEFDWITISDLNPSSVFSWNTTEVEDGSYLIQVIASDGEVKVISSPVLVNIKNVLPSFVFLDGRSTITNYNSIVIKGKALSSVNTNPRPEIMSVAYSMDGGLTWAPVKIANDGSSSVKKFEVTFSDLKEGSYPVVWWTKDSRGFVGKAVHPIIIDKTSPKIPDVISPRIDGEVIIKNTDDENLKKDGVQISIKGKTESYIDVVLSYNGQIFKTKSSPIGNFIFSDVTFVNKGKYDLNIYTIDQASNKSDTKTISVLYNNPPIISFIEPKQFRGVSKNANISWNIKDVDGDIISGIVVSYRNKDKDTLFKNLVSNANAVGSYNWDTSNLAESNNYELKISAGDEYSTSSSMVSFSIDRTAPILTSFVLDNNTLEEKSKKSSFRGVGEATDNLSGIEFVEYSLLDTNGVKSPWYKGIIKSGFLKNKASYQIRHPLLSEDGSYKVYARAVDTSGNVSEPLLLSLSVDKTAPRVGGFFFKKNNIDLTPDEKGNIIIYKNSPFIFSISLEDDTEYSSLFVGSKEFKLEKDVRSQLWTTNISVDGELKEKIFITAMDVSGNKIEDKEIGSIEASPRGVITMFNDDNIKEHVTDADIEVLKLNEETNHYSDFIISNSGNSMVSSNSSGEYDLVLPAGSYKFIISGDGIKTYKYQLVLDRSSIINLDFNVSKISKMMTWINKFLEIFK